MTAAERTRRLELVSASIAVVAPLAFLAVGALRAYPFIDDVTIPSPNGDDWHTYKQFAASVVRDGLTMPAVAGTYAGLPHGFLYVYFLALIFAVFGVNSTYVYVAQSLGLGLSISFMYLALRRRLTASGTLVFILTLAALMYIDVFRHLTFKLLSENLYLVLCPLFLLALFRGLEERNDHARRDLFGAGVMLGLVILTRPSFILSGFGVIAATGIYWWVRGRSPWPLAMMLLGLAIGLSGVVARNYFLTGRVTFDIVTDTSDWLRIWDLPVAQFLTALVNRSAFVFGVTGILAPAYRLRPYWMILWLLWAFYPIFKLSRRQPIEFWELLLYIYVVLYIGPVILVADITSYGGRMVIAILPLVLVPACRLFFASEAAVAARPASTAGPVSREMPREVER